MHLRICSNMAPPQSSPGTESVTGIVNSMAPSAIYFDDGGSRPPCLSKICLERGECLRASLRSDLTTIGHAQPRRNHRFVSLFKFVKLGSKKVIEELNVPWNLCVRTCNCICTHMLFICTHMQLYMYAHVIYMYSHAIVYVRTCNCIYTHMLFICTQMQLYIIRTCNCICTHMQLYMYAHAIVYGRTCNCIWTLMQLYMYAHAIVQVRTFICICTHMQLYMYAHTIVCECTCNFIRTPNFIQSSN